MENHDNQPLEGLDDDTWSDIDSSEVHTQKLTRKQKLMKLFLTTELKNKHLWKPLRDAKDSLIRNFQNWSFKTSDINQIFWIYFNEDKNIHITSHLKKYLPKYTVEMDWSSKDFNITFQQYLLFLEYIKIQTDPFVQQIKPLVGEATKYAHTLIAKDSSDGMFSEYQMQDENKFFCEKTKEKLSSLMELKFTDKHLYTKDWFNRERKNINQKLLQHDYSSVCIFALLWCHLFDSKHEVFNAFPPEILNKQVDFVSSSNENNSITLKDFLTIISHLNFKEKLFWLK